MKIPWVVYASVAAEALPLLGAGIRRMKLSSARKWVLAWCVFLLAANLLTLALARQNRNNHWLTYVVTPIAGGIALWALSLWQTSAVARLWLRLLVPLLGISWVVIVIAMENTQTFSLLAEPFAGLLVLGGAIYTLVSRTHQETGNLLKQDWLWVGLGLALSSGSAVALPPASRLLVHSHPELVVRAYEVKALIEILALLAITVAMLCPIVPWRTGEAYSRASQRSAA